MHSTKQPIVASATNSGNINFIVPTGKIHVNNFTEWLEKHGYLKRGINQSAASRFLRALDPKAVHFTFQTFDDNDDRKSDKLGKKSHGTLQKCWAELVGLSKRGAGVFVTINETNLQGREASDIIRVRALFVDLDGASLNAILNDNEIPKPHIIIESSKGHWHVYWLVSNVPLKAFRSLQKFLIARFNADKKIHDLPRVLRLPGFPHQKIKKGVVSPPFISRIHSINQAPPYDVEVFSSLMPEQSTFDGEIDDDDDPETPELETSAEKQKVIKEKYADVEVEKVEAALNAISADCSYDEWRNALTVAYHSGLPKDVADKWSMTALKRYTAAAFRHQWKASAKMYQIGPGTLYQYADRQKPEWRQELDERQLQEAFAAIREVTTARIKQQPDPQQPQLTEANNDDDDNDEEIIGKIAWPRPIDLWGTNFDPPPLPRGLLPPLIEELAFTEGENMGCDPSGIAIGALTVCAATIPDYVKLQVKQNSDTWKESARIWAMLVGEVSAKKTPIINLVSWPLKTLDSELHREYIKALQRYEALDKEQRDQEEKPTHQRVRLEDTTMESAQEIFKDSPNGLLCLQDELSGWFGMMDRYNGGGAKDRAFWLQAFNGGPYIVDRIKRGSFEIPNLSACLLGGIQPDRIREFAADGVDDGLLQRSLPIILRPATADRDEMRDDINDEYKKLVTRLHQIEPPIRLLNFSPGAQKIRREMADKHLALMKCTAISKKFAAHMGKYDGIFARLCVVFHCIETIKDRNFQTNVNLCIFENITQRVADFMSDFLLPHAISFYSGVLGLADNHESLANVANYILAKQLSKIDNRTIQRGNRSMRRMSKRDIDDVFDHLDAFGWISKVTDKNRTTYGIVNPRVHTLFAERGKQEAQRANEAKEAIFNAIERRRKNA